MPTSRTGAIRREEEIEYTVNSAEARSVQAIFEDVLHCKRVSSYGRIRNFFEADGVELTLDQFPFGLMLELELKTDEMGEQRLFEVAEKLKLNLTQASHLSCDDKYGELCHKAGVTPLSDIAFDDKTMPTIERQQA